MEGRKIGTVDCVDEGFSRPGQAGIHSKDGAEASESDGFLAVTLISRSLAMDSLTASPAVQTIPDFPSTGRTLCWQCTLSPLSSVHARGPSQPASGVRRHWRDAECHRACHHGPI